jgi:hypothetical protein
MFLNDKIDRQCNSLCSVGLIFLFYIFTSTCIYILCKKQNKLPHKICYNIFLHPGRREYHIIYVYNMIIVQVRYITIETKEVARIGYYRFLFPHSYVH